ncbi:MAG: ATP-binding cassette domain-containing protein [Akkermansiaceae bacterium]|nr:ATP-binding cassette domain-containing protein [Verrucomicrobiales bacterium]
MPDAPARQTVNLILKNILLPLADFVLEIDLELHCQVTAIFGPSGAGKTSLLDLIAGLRRPKSALITLDHQILTDTAAGVSVATRLRRIGYVPQDLALFPHLSVKENLLYGHRPDANSNRVFRYEHVTEVFEIQSLTERRIQNLSGGEKQRVALARALLSSPRLLLLDEPLASLDAGLKSRIIPYLARIRDEFPIAMLYVTHDWPEVQPLCSEVLVMERGRVLRRGKPTELSPNAADDHRGT